MEKQCHLIGLILGLISVFGVRAGAENIVDSLFIDGRYVSADGCTMNVLVGDRGSDSRGLKRILVDGRDQKKGVIDFALQEAPDHSRFETARIGPCEVVERVRPGFGKMPGEPAELIIDEPNRDLISLKATCGNAKSTSQRRVDIIFDKKTRGIVSLSSRGRIAEQKSSANIKCGAFKKVEDVEDAEQKPASARPAALK